MMYYEGDKFPQIKGKFVFSTFVGDIYILTLDKITGKIVKEERGKIDTARDKKKDEMKNVEYKGREEFMYRDYYRKDVSAKKKALIKEIVTKAEKTIPPEAKIKSRIGKEEKRLDKASTETQIKDIEKEIGSKLKDLWESPPPSKLQKSQIIPFISEHKIEQRIDEIEKQDVTLEFADKFAEEIRKHNARAGSPKAEGIAKEIRRSQALKELISETKELLRIPESMPKLRPDATKKAKEASKSGNDLIKTISKDVEKFQRISKEIRETRTIGISEKEKMKLSGEKVKIQAIRAKITQSKRELARQIKEIETFNKRVKEDTGKKVEEGFRKLKEKK